MEDTFGITLTRQQYHDVTASLLVARNGVHPGSEPVVAHLDDLRSMIERQVWDQSVPCGWCDAPVPVDADRGQVVYCSPDHARMDGYHPDGAY